jgi:hypothetical protein
MLDSKEGCSLLGYYSAVPSGCGNVSGTNYHSHSHSVQSASRNKQKERNKKRREGKTFHLFIRLERGSRISRMISEGRRIFTETVSMKSHNTVFTLNP